MGDNYYGKTYAECMADEPAHIVLTIDYSQPIELGDFVGGFLSIEGQFERFIRERYPDVKTHPEVFVKELRPGSIVADFLPYVGSIMSVMEQAVIAEEFVRFYGERIGRYFNLGGRDEKATKSDLKDFMGAVAAIARDPNATATIEAAAFEDKIKKVRAAIKFASPEARVAYDEIEKHRREIEQGTTADHPRVLMVFTQSRATMRADQLSGSVSV